MKLNSTPSWRPSTFLLGTAGFHVLAALWLAAKPEHWRQVGAAVALNHAVICGAGMLPRSTLLGANTTRLDTSSRASAGTSAVTTSEVIALTFDDGPDPAVTPQVLDLLDAHDAQASFFCIGRRAAQHPDLVREIVQRGHRVENHSYSHPNTFSFHGPRAMAAEIDRAQDILSSLSGSAPAYFRAPAGIRNPWLDPLLQRRQLRLASWTRRGFDTVERQPERIERRLLSGLAAGDILLLHDTSGLHGRPVVLEVLPRVLEACARRQLRSVALPIR